MTATIDTLRQKQAALKAKLREADRLLKGTPARFVDPSDAHRALDARLKRESRHRGAEISIPLPEDIGRRIECLDNAELFLSTYFPDVFYQEFTPDRREMLEAIRFAATHGGDQSAAGPRGEGKTRLAIYESFRLALKRVIEFPLLITKNAGAANEALDTLKRELETNDLLAADFPEVCVPIRELDGWASRARKQHVNGHKPDVLWTKDLIAFPTIPTEVLAAVDKRWADLDSCAAGQLFACVGIEGRIRGRNVRNKRPDLAIIDDVDDRESANSEKQTDDRESIIDSDIAGLAGPGKQVARVMLCTLLNRRCVAFKFTDPKQKPTWKGKRLKSMLQEPERKDLWDEYIDLYQSGLESGTDPHARAATRFYEEHREDMDRGAVMSNPANYVTALAEDGEPMELSAVQAFYNKVARFGWNSVLTEYQQDPPLDGEPEPDGLSKGLIRSRLSGIPRRVVPFGAKLVAQIDLGKYRIHHCSTAWLPGAIGSVIDYGEVRTGDPEAYGAEIAIRTALDELAEQWTEEPYCDPDGEVIPFSVVLIDAGNWNTVVYDFCRDKGGPFKPSMGDPKFHMPIRATTDKKPGVDFWYLSRQRHKGGTVWVVNTNPDKAKLWLHGRLLTPTWLQDEAGMIAKGDDGKPIRSRGSLALYGSDPRVHGEFADHILAERFEREFVEGKKGLEERWKKVSPNNHYLDCLYGCCVGASMSGIRLLGETAPKRRRVSFAERRKAAQSRR